MQIACIKALISGRVQGVFFRASTARQARELNVTGYARNLPDGRVEVLACGGEEAVESLRRWLESGPPAARVSGVAVEQVEVDPPRGFTTG